MCDRWRDSFKNFYVDMGECPPNKTLDRVDPNKGYSRENCRWATAAEQARTRTDNVIVVSGGRKVILKDFAAEMGVKYKSLHQMMRLRKLTAHQAAQRLRDLSQARRLVAAPAP